MIGENTHRFFSRRATACFLACVLMIGTLAGLSPSAQAAYSYDDVSSSDWFYTAVDYVTTNGYMSAASGTKFQPATPMTRAQFVEVLYRMVGSPAVTTTVSFSDVPSYHVNAKAIPWAVNTGMTNGTGNNQFTPYGTLTRETIATFMDRYIANFGEGKFSATVSYNGYNDSAAINSWALPSVKMMTQYGVFQGDNYGRFNPQNNISRAECATIVMRVDQKLNAPSPTPAPMPTPSPTPTPTSTPTPSTDTTSASQVETALRNYLSDLGVSNSKMPTRDSDLDRAAAYAASNSNKALEQVFSALNINKPLGTVTTGQYTTATYSGAITNMSFTTASTLISDMDARYSAPVRTLPTSSGEVPEYTHFGIAIVNGKCVIITYDNGGFTSTDNGAQSSDYLAAQLAMPLNATAEQQEMLSLINAERAKVGVPTVKMLPGLNEAAEIRADEYIPARNQYGPHSRLDGSSGSMIIAEMNIPLTNFGEIATYTTSAANQMSANRALNNWVDSSPHKKILTNANSEYIGIAHVTNQYGNTWIAIFLESYH